MQLLKLNFLAVLLAANLFSQANVLLAAEPAPPPSAPASADAAPAGPKRPDRKLKFADRPSIPFSELHFANDNLRRRAEHFHNQADALVAKQGRADRYKDVTHSDRTWYRGVWTIIQDVQSFGLGLYGRTIDGRDVFGELQTAGRAEAGDWSVEVSLKLAADPRRDWESARVTYRPLAKPHQPPVRALRPIYLLTPNVSVGVDEGTLRYALSMQLPHSQDAERIARLMYGTPEDFLQLASEDIETLRKLAKQELPMRITVYDNRDVSSAEPPRPGPVEKLSPETRAKLEALLDARLDSDLALLKSDYRDLHKAIPLALPRELFDSKAPPLK